MKYLGNGGKSRKTQKKNRKVTKKMKKHSSKKTRKTRNQDDALMCKVEMKKEHGVYSEKEFNSGDGMLTAVWGPSLWHTLHTISFVVQ